MDEKQIQTNGGTSPAKAPASVGKIVVQCILIAVAFLAVFAAVFLYAKGRSTLTTTAQSILYPGLSAFLLGGLTVLWLYYQTGLDRNEPGFIRCLAAR